MRLPTTMRPKRPSRAPPEPRRRRARARLEPSFCPAKAHERAGRRKRARKAPRARRFGARATGGDAVVLLPQPGASPRAPAPRLLLLTHSWPVARCHRMAIDFARQALHGCSHYELLRAQGRLSLSAFLSHLPGWWLPGCATWTRRLLCALPVVSHVLFRERASEIAKSQRGCGFSPNAAPRDTSGGRFVAGGQIWSLKQGGRILHARTWTPSPLHASAR